MDRVMLTCDTLMMGNASSNFFPKYLYSLLAACLALLQTPLRAHLLQTLTEGNNKHSHCYHPVLPAEDRQKSSQASSAKLPRAILVLAPEHKIVSLLFVVSFFQVITVIQLNTRFW